jgi:hypothetical protein
MPAGSLIQLVAHSVNDIYLIGNPQMTFFKAVYKRHTNFVMESIRAVFEGETDFGNKLVCKIPRNGDLMHTMVLEVDLPQLTATGSDDVNSIRYISNIGYNMIDYCEIRIGSQLIDRQYGEWMAIWSELTYTTPQKQALSQMVKGDAQNGPMTVYIPFQFWFCRHIGAALPLVALQYHEVELDIYLRPLSQLYNMGPIHYYDLTYLANPAPGQYQYQLANGIMATPDITGKTLYYSAGSGSATITYDSPDTIILNQLLSGSQLTRAYVVPTYVLTGTPSILDMRLYVDYIFLDTYERKYFANNEHRYLIEQCQFNENESIDPAIVNKKVKLEFNMPVKELYWLCQTSENATNNELSNYTNSPDIYYQFPSDFINLMTIMFNGNDRFYQRAGEYFRLIQPFQGHTNIPFDKFINVFSFALDPEEYQPMGSANFSKLDTVEFYMEMAANNPACTIRVYAVNYNLLRISNGMGGVAFSN